VRFGIAFCEASGARLIRRSGNDAELMDHAFLIMLRGGFPVNVLNPVKAVPEVCTLFCATANPVEVIVAVSDRGRGIAGVIDGLPPVGTETDADAVSRHHLLREIGYKH
jgi:uncharacterized protein